MNSLKLCFSIGDLKNFKIVYLLYYREGLTDQQIREYSENITGDWIDLNIVKDSELGILCYKVLLEDCVNNTITNIQVPELECNISLNKWLASNQKVRFI